eukprot:CAMPEP_0185573202 /NCGR_PEP_ID=MMETSP0434-20130131/4971_2 /TAXON_ID=626734 ORGANISM="Favella taraikaensis, Strain Fe Narragansett Bay" /NCGR_SAMPLE_ID=MMETSP0434 /ASSEMBLY_ACC=CAM_ASM_000379 /LENGTH=40 /DNA_ID= /DNA_START= /DNA_END= /DNA_ORIENTATION=
MLSGSSVMSKKSSLLMQCSDPSKAPGRGSLPEAIKMCSEV